MSVKRARARVKGTKAKQSVLLAEPLRGMRCPMSRNDGPFLALAIICERVLVERDDVMSLIRIFDQWIIKGPTEKMPSNTVVPFNLVLSFRAGRFRGAASVTIKETSPSDIVLWESTASVQFPIDKGDEQGSNLLASLNLAAAEEGIYWFEISLENHVITRIPLKIAYQRIVEMATMPERQPT
jgi:hypothetical protein